MRDDDAEIHVEGGEGAGLQLELANLSAWIVCRLSISCFSVSVSTIHLMSGRGNEH